MHVRPEGQRQIAGTHDGRLVHIGVVRFDSMTSDRGRKAPRQATAPVIDLGTDRHARSMVAEFRRMPVAGRTRFERARDVWDRLGPALEDDEYRELASLGRRAIVSGEALGVRSIPADVSLSFLGFLVILADSLAHDDA